MVDSSINSTSHTDTASSEQVVKNLEIPGVTFHLEETLLGVGFVLAAFGILALIFFKDVAFAKSSQDLSSQEWTNWKRRTRAAGYTLVFLGAANLAIVHVIMHILSEKMTYCEGLFWRSLSCLALSVLGCHAVGVNLLVDFDIFQWISFPCLLHSSSVLLVFIGLSTLPTSEATALYATYPCWALLFTYCIVQEPLGSSPTAGIFGTLIGIIFIVQPFQNLGINETYDVTRLSSALLTVLGGMLSGMLAITIRRMGVRVHYMLLSAWMSMYGIGLSIAVPLIQGRGPLFLDGHFSSFAQHSPPFVVCMGLFMLCSCVSLFCLNWALQLENAGSISMVQVGILISFQYILDVSMGSASSSGMSIAGIVLVLVSCFAIYTTRTAEVKSGDYSHVEAPPPTGDDFLPAPAVARSALVHGERYET